MNLLDLAKELKRTNKEIPQTMLVFGDAFTGKTSLVAQLARKYKLKWVDTDAGYSAIFKALPEEYWKNIDLVEVRETPAKAVSAATVHRILSARGPIRISDSTGVVNCVETTKNGGTFTEWDPTTWDTNTVLVFDSLSTIGDSAIKHYLGGTTTMEFGEKSFKHYDKQGLLLTAILGLSQRMKCHVVFITHQEELEMEDGKKKLAPVCGTRNLSTRVGRYFSHCLHCSIKNKKHVVNSNTVGDLRVIAGSRQRVEVTDTESLLKIFELDLEPSGDTELEINAEDAVDETPHVAKETEEAKPKFQGFRKP